MNKLDPISTNKLLNQATQVLVKFNPNANYRAESTGTDMRDFVRLTIKEYNLTRDEHLQDLLLFRRAFEKQIRKKYGVKFTYKFNEDVELKYRKRGVPQLIQVKSGILDLIIGELHAVYINVNKLLEEAR
jgi:hypothetical protein